MGWLSDFLFGKDDEVQQHSTLTDQQSQFLNSLLGQLMGQGGAGGSYGMANDYLSSILGNDPEAFQRFSQPYMEQFNQQVIPGIAERFSGSGAQNSSAFAQALGSAGAGLESQLAQLREGMRGNAANSALSNFNSLANLGLGTRAFENMMIPGYNGIIQSGINSLAQGAGMGLGGMGFNWLSGLFNGGGGMSPYQAGGAAGSAIGNQGRDTINRLRR